MRLSVPSPSVGGAPREVAYTAGEPRRSHAFALPRQALEFGDDDDAITLPASSGPSGPHPSSTQCLAPPLPTWISGSILLELRFLVE